MFIRKCVFYSIDISKNCFIKCVFLIFVFIESEVLSWVISNRIQTLCTHADKVSILPSPLDISGRRKLLSAPRVNQELHNAVNINVQRSIS